MVSLASAGLLILVVRDERWVWLAVWATVGLVVGLVLRKMFTRQGGMT
jgi:hypothetical protein